MSRYPLSLTAQSVFHPTGSPPTQTVTSQLGYKMLQEGGYVELLAKIEVDGICCFILTP